MLVTSRYQSLRWSVCLPSHVFQVVLNQQQDRASAQQGFNPPLSTGKTSHLFSFVSTSALIFVLYFHLFCRHCLMFKMELCLERNSWKNLHQKRILPFRSNIYHPTNHTARQPKRRHEETHPLPNFTNFSLYHRVLRNPMQHLCPENSLIVN